MCDTENYINFESEEDDNLFQLDVGRSFECVLTDLPQVLDYIKRLQDCVIRQRRIIITLRGQQIQGASKIVQCDASTQTEDLLPWQQSVGDKESSIVDQVKEVAESVVRQTGFVYEATSGMYYDYNTGYYYNAELGLYYNGNNGTYYSYDEKDKEFRYHSSVSAGLPESNENPSKSVESSTNDGSQSKEKDSQVTITASLDQANGNETGRETVEEMEEGECSRESFHEEEKKQNKRPVDDCLSAREESSHIEPMLTDTGLGNNLSEEIANSWPPCMRVIVQETDLAKLTVGSLFIVTCIGGSLGREGNHAILVPDLKISKHHARISFSEEETCYLIVDLGSRNGTYVNDVRLSVALRESDPTPLRHGDVLRVAGTRLLCHVHAGQETCQSCEPGCCQLPPTANAPTKDKVDSLDSTERHRTELRRLRQKFGLENAGAAPRVPNASNYVDRAEARRKTVGSTDGSFKTETASVHETINCDNKGFKMLSKMGWSKGQALGKDSTDPTSITEPILVEQRRSKVGLGCEDTEPVTADNKEIKKAMIWNKARKRYKKLS